MQYHFLLHKYHCNDLGVVGNVRFHHALISYVIGKMDFNVLSRKMNKNIIMSSFKSSQKKEGGPDSCLG